MLQWYDILPLLQQVLVYIPATDDLLLYSDVRIQIHLQLARAFAEPHQIHTELLP